MHPKVISLTFFVINKKRVRGFFNTWLYHLRLRNFVSIRGSALNGIPQAVTIHISLSTTACTSVNTFCHPPCASWSRRRLCETNKICDLTHFVSCTKKCRHFHWLSFCGAIVKYAKITNLFLRVIVTEHRVG